MTGLVAEQGTRQTCGHPEHQTRVTYFELAVLRHGRKQFHRSGTSYGVPCKVKFLQANPVSKAGRHRSQLRLIVGNIGHARRLGQLGGHSR